MGNGCTSPLWVAFKQALALEAHVRKGEHMGWLFQGSRRVR
jgi:antirestriction protein ArdC